VPEAKGERKKGKEVKKKEKLGVELPYLFYVLGIGECRVVDLLESVHPGSEYLGYQIWPFPGRGQLVPTFLAPHSS
jgi:hypothetical protein